MKKMDYFFKPSSVAVIGASRNPKKIGHVILRNFIEGKYKGKIYPVNPKADYMFDLKAYPSVTRIPGKLDLAIISVPALFARVTTLLSYLLSRLSSLPQN